MVDTPKKPAAARKTAATAKKPVAAKTPKAAKATMDAVVSDAVTAKNSFTDQAKEKAQYYASDAKEKASAYADEAREKAKAFADEAKEKASAFAGDAKVRTSEAVTNVSKLIEESASVIDEKLGVKYGDYARTAAQKVSGFATTIEEKDLSELGNDTREFVKKSPAVALGIAAVAGFILSRFVGGGSKDD